MGHREGRRCSRDICPEFCITKYTSVRRLKYTAGGEAFEENVRLLVRFFAVVPLARHLGRIGRQLSKIKRWLAGKDVGWKERIV